MPDILDNKHGFRKFVRFFWDGMDMFRIYIQGMKDGEYEIDMKVLVSDMPDMYKEYFGKIKFEGKLRKLGTRFSLVGDAECKAKLICDRSLEEYTEVISAPLKLAFVTDTVHRGNFDETKEEMIKADDKYVDISENIREIFALNLPMKRIAPGMRNRELTELFPEYIKNEKINEENKIDERWAPLMKLKNNRI